MLHCWSKFFFPVCVAFLIQYYALDPHWVDFCVQWEIGLTFNILHLNFQFFQHHLLKRLYFLQCMVSVLCLVWDNYIHVGLSLCLLFYFIGLLSLLVPIPCCFVTIALEYKGWYHDTSCFTFLAKDCISYSGLLIFTI